MVIMESDNGRVFHDNQEGVWCQSFLDKEHEEVVIKDMSGRAYERYSFDEWGERGPDNMALYNRFPAVSRRVVEDPAGFLEDELFGTRRPDPRVVDVKYAALVTGEDVSFFWEEFEHATDTYSDEVPDPE